MWSCAEARMRRCMRSGWRPLNGWAFWRRPIGKPGRRALEILLPSLRAQLNLDVVVANGENAAGGRGLTMRTARDMFESGVDIISSGNHIWDQKEIYEHLDDPDEPIVRPANYPAGSPGRGEAPTRITRYVSSSTSRVAPRSGGAPSAATIR